MLSAGTAAAAPDPRPRPDEWWFATWNIQQKVWPLSEGNGVVVAVLDTGVQANVADLAGVVLPGGDTAGGGDDGRSDADTQTDGHGTAMSVLIAGQGGGTGMAGIAPGARILPVVVNRAGSSGPTMSAAIRFAVDHGAKVINISQGAPGVPPPACDSGVQQAVAYAAEHDVVVVASAGDSGNTDNYPQWPASCAGVLAVGGVEPDGSLWPGSQRESYVDVTGPGDHVGWSGKDGKYIPDSYGTSGAAALVSGAAALIRSRYPSMPARTVVQRLINTTVPLGHPVPNDSTGYGLIDIFRALDVHAYPVAASAPNPPFAALDQWLASPAGRQAGAATGPPSLPPASPVAGPAGASGGGIAPVAIIVAIVALLLVAAVVALVVYVARRGRRGHGVPYSGARYRRQQYPGPQPPYPGGGPAAGAGPTGQSGHGPPPGYFPAQPPSRPPGYGAYPGHVPPGPQQPNPGYGPPGHRPTGPPPRTGPPPGNPGYGTPGRVPGEPPPDTTTGCDR